MHVFYFVKAISIFWTNDGFPKWITSRSLKSNQKKLRSMSIVNQVSAMLQNFQPQLHWSIVICKYFRVVELLKKPLPFRTVAVYICMFIMGISLWKNESSSSLAILLTIYNLLYDFLFASPSENKICWYKIWRGWHFSYIYRTRKHFLLPPAPYPHLLRGTYILYPAPALVG